MVRPQNSYGMKQTDLILLVAESAGWRVDATAENGNTTYFDLIRETERGLPFLFSAAITDGDLDSLICDLQDSLDKFDVIQYVRTWYITDKSEIDDYICAYIEMNNMKKAIQDLLHSLRDVSTANARNS